MEIGSSLVVGGGALIGRLLPKLIPIATDKYKKRVQAQINDAVFTDLAGRLLECTQVKTIWRYQDPVSLYSFYHPSRVQLRWGGIISPRNAASLQEQHVVIEGMVGMGKSLLLRFLVGQELREETSSGRIPIFLELRRLRAGQSLISFITTGLQRYGFDVDDELTGIYLRSGTLVLFLDGFDEVDEAKKTSLVDELEGLVQLYREKVQIIVSSRPESGIQNSAYFGVARMAPLEKTEHAAFFEKVGLLAEEAKQLDSEIDRVGRSIGELLKTPLLLTLLVMVYKAHRTIPDSIPRFYEELFDVLFVFHDRSKPGYSRERRTTLSDTVVRRLFEEIAFRARASGRNEFSKLQMERIVAESAAKQRVVVDSQAYIEDVIQTSSLLLRDGQSIAFLHKSVAEYFAASFVAQSIEKVAEQFYSQLVTKLWLRWLQELTFLQQIDEYRYRKYFQLKAVDAQLREISGEPEDAASPLAEFIRHHARHVNLDWKEVNIDEFLVEGSFMTFDEPYGLREFLALWANDAEVAFKELIIGSKDRSWLRELSRKDKLFRSPQSNPKDPEARISLRTLADSEYASLVKRTAASARERLEARSGEIRDLLSAEEQNIDLMRLQ